MKTPLGELLVESGIITIKTLERALIRQHKQRRRQRLGGVLEEMGVITRDELIEALASQHGFQTVRELASQSYPRQLLELVPVRFAQERVVFPLRRQREGVVVAITDPCDTDTISELRAYCRTRIIPVLATREAIIAAVKRHYLGAEEVNAEAPRVLVVDHATDTTSEVAEALRKEGYQVLIANDGVEGLGIAFSQRPELILCDAVIPRMDGYALMRAIKANPATAEIPMILLTSKASPEEEHRALKSGFHDFIAKPMMIIRVVSRVKRAFDIMQQVKEEHAAPAA
ncbi:response regulator [Geomonas sp. Red32]|uniref:response regulator n=1 Tax=Geomonas sp. Red32 TaxID=2912856 RepID=UPI00202CC6DE|nr:response regulator [Geomonas sp. Red32]MCM0081983.1 response regulator [Geomonas sp. Red32]